MQDPWTLYWQSGNLDSCVPTRSLQDATAVSEFWQLFAAKLEANSTILDLATGNGTVPAALLGANRDLEITGVDKAEIDPLRFLAEPGVLASVDFRGNIDASSLPFGDEEFDTVTSQFGIEYAALRTAVPEAVRVLKRGGNLGLLIHHADSEVVKPARANRREMEALLADGGVLQTLKSYVTGQLSEAALESAGQAHVASDAGRSSQITGQIFEGVNRVINSVRSGDRGAGSELCEVMLLRLNADRDRLQLLEDVACTRSQFDEIVEMFKAEGVNAAVASALCANEGTDDEFVIAWQYLGQKN